MFINDWEVLAHPLFLDQYEALVVSVDKDREKNPKEYQTTANAKLLAALNRLLYETIPAEPTRPEYRQGATLGDLYKHWFRAKFGGQRFRLFFRYDSRAKIIIYAWVNDSESLRTYGAKTDAYAVFKKMLGKGNPPDDWNALLKAAKSTATATRWERTRSR